MGRFSSQSGVEFDRVSRDAVHLQDLPVEDIRGRYVEMPGVRTANILHGEPCHPSRAKRKSSMQQKSLSGRCLCGAVRFRLLPPLRDVVVCHCRQCAQWTGSTVAATAVPLENFELVAGAADLTWYAASPGAERGFCGRCGSSLFWKPSDGSRISVLAGGLEPPTGLVVGAHVFVADKSDYYEICDDALRFQASGGGRSRTP